MDRPLLRRLLLSVSLLACTACGPAHFAVRDPAPSSIAYVGTPDATTTLAIRHAPTDQPFMTGRLPGTLDIGGQPLDPPAFLARALQAEFAARGLPVAVSTQADSLPMLDVASFRMQNHRVSGYSPFVTFTSISADLVTATGRKRLVAYVKRGKVPVWSFKEVIDPTMNEPLSIAAKELAAKIASTLYGARAADADVDALVSKVRNTRLDAYLNVYALGFSNNPRAVPALVELTHADAEYMRLAAISSLGTLGATEQFGLLRDLSQNATLWQDRAMAVKSIADLGTPEARAFLVALRDQLQGRTDRESKWLLELLALYA